VAKINEIIQGELPQLVDDRRFRRREQEPVERDELGRVSDLYPLALIKKILTHLCSANGVLKRSPSTWSPFQASISEPKSSATAGLT
jgi:hypothetical protein